MSSTGQDAGEGPGGGERSEPEPGPADARRGLGAGTGKAKRYTPEERRWALEAWEQSGLGAAMFARQWGLSTPTLYEWKRARARGGPQALEHPTSSGTGRPRGATPIAAPVVAEIVATKRAFPDFGLKKVRDYLARFAGLRVSTGGVRAVLAREGVAPTEDLPRRGRRRTRPAVRNFERAKPGQLWQSDFTSYVLGRSGRPAHLIVFMDDCSRYVVSWRLEASATAAVAKDALRAGIEKYGKPVEVLTDRGPQYHAWRGKSAFRKLAEREGIKPVLSRSHHPQTLGKCERLWETIGRELWDRTHPADIDEARERLTHFFRHYNHFRPHQGIGGMVPADRFFSAESEVRRAIESSITKNELRLALGERPRRSVYLVGQVDGESVSLHGERGRLVVSTKDGVTDMDLNELGMQKEARDEQADGRDGGGRGGRTAEDGRRDDAAGDGGAEEEAAAQRGRLPASGLSDQRDSLVGDGGGDAEGAPPGERTPGILAGPREQGGSGAAAVDAADPCVAALAAGDDGHGGGDAAAAAGETRSDAEDRSGDQGLEEARRGARGGDVAAAAPDRAPADDAGQRAPRTPEGSSPEGGERCVRPEEAQVEQAQDVDGTRHFGSWSWSSSGTRTDAGVTGAAPHGRST